MLILEATCTLDTCKGTAVEISSHWRVPEGPAQWARVQRRLTRSLHTHLSAVACCPSCWETVDFRVAPVEVIEAALASYNTADAQKDDDYGLLSAWTVCYYPPKNGGQSNG